MKIIAIISLNYSDRPQGQVRESSKSKLFKVSLKNNNRINKEMGKIKTKLILMFNPQNLLKKPKIQIII